jgi:hypothetical protein
MYRVNKFQGEEKLFGGATGFRTWEDICMEKTLLCAEIKTHDKLVSLLCVFFTHRKQVH